MKVLFERSFLKDLRKLDDKKLKDRIDQTIDEHKAVENANELLKAEKMTRSFKCIQDQVGELSNGSFHRR